MTLCPLPLGVANAYITSQGPYNTSDFITYSCLSGFSMTGTPSQVCGSAGQWEGTPPVCSPISFSPYINNSQSVTSSTDVPLWLIVTIVCFMGIMIIIFVSMLCFYVCTNRLSRIQNSAEKNKNDTPNSPGSDVERAHQRAPSLILSDYPDNYMSSKESSSVSNIKKLSEMHPSEIDSKKANELKAMWMPHRHPIRSINTSTK